MKNVGESVLIWMPHSDDTVFNTSVMYSIQPVQWTYPHGTGAGLSFVLASSDNRTIDHYSSQIAEQMEVFDVALNYSVPNALRGHLKQRLRKAQEQYIRVSHRYLNALERISKSRKTQSGTFAWPNEERLLLDNEMHRLTMASADLQSKAQLIARLRSEHFHYRDVANCALHGMDDMHLLEDELASKHQNVRILCSNDTLNETQHARFQDIRQQLLRERSMDPQLHLVYADFSYCSFSLPAITVLDSRAIMKRQIASSVPTDETINVLLIGETTVGKSTFINALANYFTFTTLEQAQSNPPVVLIPVSFLLDGQLMAAGDLNRSINQDFDHSGPSVTQRCQSYLFHLPDPPHNKKVRIIDTPGFGDTDDPAQNHLTMQHILQYVSCLPHLNAVCFLVKANASRLTTFTRTCLTELFDFLGARVRDNVIFCFTHAQTTSFTPDDQTAILLRATLASLPTEGTLFRRANTFCFDQNSFRYLVALQHGIEFARDASERYAESWSVSIAESTRLLNYIARNPVVYRQRNEWQSIKQAEIDITVVIRPILEAIRNLLRNLLLHKIDPSHNGIVLRPNAVLRPIAGCYSCKRDPFFLNHLWILPDHSHECRNQCRTCSCPRSDHRPIDYLLCYESSSNGPICSSKTMILWLNELYSAATYFGYFLEHATRSQTRDPFCSGLQQMISDEEDISIEQTPNRLNVQLVQQLQKLLGKYEAKKKRLRQRGHSTDLPMLHERFQAVCRYPMVHEQMQAIAVGREMNMNQHAFEIIEN